MEIDCLATETFWSSFMEAHNPMRLLGNIMTAKIMLSTK